MVAQGTGPDGPSEPRMTPNLGAPGQGGAGQGAKRGPWAGGAPWGSLGDYLGVSICPSCSMSVGSPLFPIQWFG